MSITNLIKFFSPLILTAFALFLITQPIFHDGLFQSMDDIQVVRIEEMYKELKSRQFPVRIATDLANSAGYMLFNFYSPLVYYLGAFFHFLNFTLVISTKLVFLSGFLIGWFGIYLLLKYKFNTLTAIFGSIIFLLAPYLGYDAYQRGALAEFFAFCLLPLLFFSLLNLSQKGSKLYFLVSSLTVASLIISHNLTAMITLPFIVILILVLRGKYFISFSSVFLGLALSSFYWIPAIFESQFIIINQVEFITKTYQNHFLSPVQLIGFEKAPWGFLPPALGVTIFLGSVFAIPVLILQKFSFISKKGYDSFIIFCLISYFICLLMASSFSKTIWEILSPPLNYLQFPWRFLTLATFFGTICCSYLIYKTSPLKDKLLVTGLLIVPLFFSYQSYFQPVGYNFIAKYTADDPCGTAGWSNEYIPIWAKECFPKGSKLEELNIIAGDIKISNLQIKNHSRLYEFNSESTQSGKILFKKYYFPGWRLKLDGLESSVSATLPYGLIEAQIPKGNHSVKLKFQNTPIRTFSNVISLTGILIFIWLGYKLLRGLKLRN